MNRVYKYLKNEVLQYDQQTTTVLSWYMIEPPNFDPLLERDEEIDGIIEFLQWAKEARREQDW